MEATGCRIIRYRQSNAVFSIWDIGDIHWMTRGCHKALFRRDIQTIKRDPYSLFFIGGDYADFVLPGDKRFDPEALPVDLRVVDLTHLSAVIISSLADELAPIRSKCLGIAYGNHEHRYMTHSNVKFLHDEFCAAMNGAPNLMYCGWADLYFVEDRQARGVTVTTTFTPPEVFTARLRVLVHHGFGASQTAGGKLMALKRMVDNVETDLLMMGHLHEQLAKSFTTLFPNENCSEIHSRTTIGMMTGTYLRGYGQGYTPYSEMRGYAATTLGANRALYRPVDMHLEVAIGATGVGLRGNQQETLGV